MENNYVHIRYQANSKPLWDKLISLGFKEEGSDHNSMGLKQVKRFKKNNLLIEDSNHSIKLFVLNSNPPAKQKEIPIYHGMSVNKELLENFSEKGVYSKMN